MQNPGANAPRKQGNRARLSRRRFYVRVAAFRQERIALHALGLALSLRAGLGHVLEHAAECFGTRHRDDWVHPHQRAGIRVQSPVFAMHARAVSQPQISWSARIRVVV